MFASCIFRFYILKPSRVEWAPSFQVQVANTPEFSNWHLAADCQLSFQLLCSKILSNRIGIWLPVASCRFAKTSETATGCRLPVAYSPVIFYNFLKSNWNLAASCQFTRMFKIATGCRLSVACSPVIFYNCLNLNWNLAASCQFTRMFKSASGLCLPVAISAIML